MRLNELTGIKEPAQQLLNPKFIDNPSKDIKLIGSGMGGGGLVYKIKNKPYVIKIVNNDAGYLRWINFCKNYTGEFKRFLPKFGKIFSIPFYNDKLVLVQMEELKRYTGKDFIIRSYEKEAILDLIESSKEFPEIKINNINDVYNLIANFGEEFYRIEKIIDNILFNKNINLKHVLDLLKSIFQFNIIYEELSENNKDFIKFILQEFIFKKIPQETTMFMPGTKLDLHEENIMFRKNGDVVLTDPWYDVSSNVLEINDLAKLIRYGKKEEFTESVETIENNSNSTKVFINPKFDQIKYYKELRFIIDEKKQNLFLEFL